MLRLLILTGIPRAHSKYAASGILSFKLHSMILFLIQFLIAILHRDLRNCFFFRHLSFIFNLDFLQIAIWSWISSKFFTCNHLYISETCENLELQIKTACAKGSASNEQLLFTFRQNGKSCKTGIPPQTKKCGHNKYEGNQLGQCVNFKFSHDQTVEGTVTYKNKRSRDGWKPEWAKLFLKDGNIMKCQFLGGLSFSCNVESKFLWLFSVLERI